MLNKDTYKEDKELVRALKNGSQLAFDKLYNQYKNRMISFAIQFIQSRELAEDTYHDIFAQIWTNKDAIDESKSFSSYLYTLMKNRLLDEIRKRLQDQKFRDSLNIDSTHNETLDGVLEEDFKSLYSASLDRLTPQQRAIFSMSRNEYKTYQEIGKQLNISVNTVKSHLSQATASIRSFISKHII